MQFLAVFDNNSNNFTDWIMNFYDYWILVFEEYCKNYNFLFTSEQLFSMVLTYMGYVELGISEVLKCIPFLFKLST